MANEYATLTELKAALRITDTADDTELQSKLTSASRRVEKDTGRRFWLDSVTSARVYTPHHQELLTVDDFSTATGLIVAVGRNTSWSTVDSNSYNLLPENAEVDGKAVETLQRVYGCWPLWEGQQVQVTAKWGWPAIPEEIKNATILLAARLFRRKDSPEGIKGFGDMGVVRVSRYDSDYDNLISEFVKDVK